MTPRARSVLVAIVGTTAACLVYVNTGRILTWTNDVSLRIVLLPVLIAVIVGLGFLARGFRDDD